MSRIVTHLEGKLWELRLDAAAIENARTLCCTAMAAGQLPSGRSAGSVRRTPRAEMRTRAAVAQGTSHDTPGWRQVPRRRRRPDLARQGHSSRSDGDAQILIAGVRARAVRKAIAQGSAARGPVP